VLVKRTGLVGSFAHEGRAGGGANSLLVEADLVQTVPELLYQPGFSYCAWGYRGGTVVLEASLRILRS